MQCFISVNDIFPMVKNEKYTAVSHKSSTLLANKVPDFSKALISTLIKFIKMFLRISPLLNLLVLSIMLNQVKLHSLTLFVCANIP